VAAGSSTSSAPDAIWAVALLGGFVSNAIFCSILLSRNRTWSRYALAGTGSYWFLAALMGLIWVVSLLIYGRAADMMGVLGSSAGWAITMGCCILASNVWGILMGEWRQARGKPLRTMYAGLAVILVAIVVIGYGR
jgi:L-rhamnose-H+ transport protein